MTDAVRRDAAIELSPSQDFPTEFNATAGSARLVLLVSPTCAVCIEGTAIVAATLGSPMIDPLALHVIWLPVLAGDSEAAARAVAAGIPTPLRARHYWDGDRHLSDLVATTIDLARYGRTVAWDLYLLYPPAVRYRHTLPRPHSWLQQLRIDEVPELSGPRLSELLDRLPRHPGRRASSDAPR
jgi:hypothetical protein